ncbi:MAG TPA: YHS domain-containing protein [Chitinophaga sp.]|uniref:YHS domain-containing protein n=1 Tax=Chitinophaga sp. TaxID=1869181 RepID=UPI002DBCBCAA|nr:YHS domain-containing protein [Chitinophaga sp.]HEU4553259.1 YHS domain-containing protein [Chitinophaga sp.]
MQKLIYAFAFAALLTACGSGAGKQQPSQDAAEDNTPATLIAQGKMGDPVCQMPYDTSYVEWSVYKGDTVHFCSPTCKGVFDKTPGKYAANLK